MKHSRFRIFPSLPLYLVCVIILCASIAFAGAGAEESIALKGLPNYRILLSSHAAASAAMLSSLGVWKNDKRPPEVLIGGLEARMYRCICDNQSLHVWEIARGLREWAGLEGWQIKVEERCLHSTKPAGMHLKHGRGAHATRCPHSIKPAGMHHS